MAALQRIQKVRKNEPPKLTREQRIDQVRKRFQLLWKALFGGVVLVFVTAIAIGEFRNLDLMDHYHEACAGIADGAPLAAGREIASAKGLVFEEDAYTSWRRDESIYVLKPDASWPDRLGCRFEVRDAQLFRTRVK